MTDATPADEQAVRDERYRLGQCPNCGTQLFKIQKKGLLKKTEFRKPLTTPGLVERGQCLQCLSSKPADDAVMAAAAIASVGENNNGSSNGGGSDSNNPQPRLAQQQPNNATAGETIYIGDFNEQGERHGPGELLWSNGDKYVGSFVNGLREGQGTLYFKDGEYACCFNEDWLLLWPGLPVLIVSIFEAVVEYFPYGGQPLFRLPRMPTECVVGLFLALPHDIVSFYYCRIGICWSMGEQFHARQWYPAFQKW